MPTLKQLRYFAALAETLHFGRAAERCQVTQPAMSMQIRELEAELGVVLVERTAAGVFLTATGAEVARRARADPARGPGSGRSRPPRRPRARRAASPGRDPDHRALSLAAGPAPAARELSRLQLSLRESQTEHLIEALVAGELDLLILALPVGRDDVATMAAVRRRLQPRGRRGPPARAPRRGRPEGSARRAAAAARGGALPARSGAEPLPRGRREPGRRLPRQQPRDRGPDGGQRLRRHDPAGPGAAGRGRRSFAAAGRAVPGAGAGAHDRPRLAQLLAAPGGLHRVRPAS